MNTPKKIRSCQSLDILSDTAERPGSFSQGVSRRYRTNNLYSSASACHRAA